MTLPMLLAAAVTVGALLYVVQPFFRNPPTATPRTDAHSRRQLELLEERDRALAALKELEFDHRTGKVSNADYRELLGPLRRHAAEALRLLGPDDPPTHGPMPPARRDRSVRPGG